MGEDSLKSPTHDNVQPKYFSPLHTGFVQFCLQLWQPFKPIHKSFDILRPENFTFITIIYATFTRIPSKSSIAPEVQYSASTWNGKIFLNNLVKMPCSWYVLHLFELNYEYRAFRVQRPNCCSCTWTIWLARLSVEKFNSRIIHPISLVMLFRKLSTFQKFENLSLLYIQIAQAQRLIFITFGIWFNWWQYDRLCGEWIVQLFFMFCIE